MSETINRVDHFYTGDFAQIMTGVYRNTPMAMCLMFFASMKGFFCRNFPSTSGSFPSSMCITLLFFMY